MAICGAGFANGVQKVSDQIPTTGQRDGLGYLRWTPTACRRCGYEQVDCTCIGGFVAPQTTDLLTIKLDWTTARLVSGACIVAAELDDTDPNDARVLQGASAVIMRAVTEAESNA